MGKSNVHCCAELLDRLLDMRARGAVAVMSGDGQEAELSGPAGGAEEGDGLGRALDVKLMGDNQSNDFCLRIG
jgi:hypothetical protein